MISVSDKKWELKKTNKNLKDKLKQDFNLSEILSILVVSRNFNLLELNTIKNNLNLVYTF